MLSPKLLLFVKKKKPKESKWLLFSSESQLSSDEEYSFKKNHKITFFLIFNIT